MCVLGVVLSYKYKYIYFALQKNNKKTNMRLMTVEECFFRCRLAVCSFFFSLNFYTASARAHAHGFTRTRPFERSPVNGHRAHSDPGTAKMLGCHRGKQSLFRTRVCDTWSKGGTSESLAEGGPLVRKVTRGCVRAWVLFACVSVCVCR